ncbi:MarR family winged helix-turn-helix transcriptional regulator [Kribbella sp. NPDC050241]|uniref:MarR family winged helix-turn-helix transcriptional regulator n=1 Tax=Kribbella sp. NPDC050241 TaxID=3364115 RepID=UPI00379B6326
MLALPSYLAGHVSRISHRTLVDALAEQSLRLPHFAVLAGLLDLGPSAQHELADRLRLNRSHLVGYLDDLERGGYVTRERDPGDRRRQQVRLAKSGTTLATELVQIAKESEARHLAVLTASERRTLTELLRRVVVTDDEAQ